MQSINWLVRVFDPCEGYGRYGMHMIRALTNCGVDVQPMTLDILEWPGWLQRQAGVGWGRLTISLMSGESLKPVPGRHWLYSMYEDTSLPDKWPGRINAAVERVIVPCEHNAEVFRKRGITVPVHVVHGGTDPAEFPTLPVARKTRPYTFTCLGDRSVRKGVEVAWSAFFRAFPDEDDVRLIVKTRQQGIAVGAGSFSDRRISFWQEDLDSLTRLYEQTDCFVYPAYGEGWGMPPREAACMGLPVIATRWSGLEVGIDNWAIPIETLHRQRSQMPTRDGYWMKPDVDEVARHMRWCYDNQDAARAKGQAASAWIHANQTWQHSAGQLMALLEEYA